MNCLVKGDERTLSAVSLFSDVSGFLFKVAACCLIYVLPAVADEPKLLRAPFDEATAMKKQQEWAKHLQREVIETNSLGMKLVLIPPGEFLMGSSETAEELFKAFPYVPKELKESLDD